MKSDNPIYQWKSHNNTDWFPPEGKIIWGKDDTTNQLIIPTMEPLAKKMVSAYKKVDEIIPYIKKYIEYLEMSSSDKSSEAYRINAPLIIYWRTISNHLLQEIDSSNILQFGFWPRTNHGTGYKTHSLPVDDPIDTTPLLNEEMMELQEEYDEEMREQDVMFVGTKAEKTRKIWNPLEDIKPDCFVVVNPSQEWQDAEEGKDRFWIVRCKGEVKLQQIDERGPIPCFEAEWWRPKHIAKNPGDKLRYADCFSEMKTWEYDPNYKNMTQKIEAKATMFSWITKSKPDKIYKSGVRIPKSILKDIREYMDRLMEKETTNTSMDA